MSPLLLFGPNVETQRQTRNLRGQKGNDPNDQKRAARFVTGNYLLIEGNTRKNMSELNWPPLTERMARIKLTILFQAKSGAIEIPMDDLIPANQNTKIVTRTNTHRLLIPDSRVDTHLYSFYPNTIRLWNQLPQQSQDLKTH